MERKYRYTLKNYIIDFSFQNCTFYLNFCYKNVDIQSRSRNRSQSRLYRLHIESTTLDTTLAAQLCETAVSIVAANENISSLLPDENLRSHFRRHIRENF